MALWIVFSTVAAALFGAMVWFTAASADRLVHPGAPPTSEATAWWQLVWPLFAGALVLAFLTGWAFQEPDPADEWVAFDICALASTVGLVVLRALVRGLRSLRSALHASAPVATVGLFRCRIVVSNAFERAASAEVLSAAVAHEAAHARARDPIRIWMAQLASDLQWPLPRARTRFRNWLLALEIHRDDEAVTAGASATALAEAILLAAKLHFDARNPTLSIASVTGDGEGLALRVRRLLSRQAECGGRASARRPWLAVYCCAALSLAAYLGMFYGDSLLGIIPGVGR